MLFKVFCEPFLPQQSREKNRPGSGSRSRSPRLSVPARRDNSRTSRDFVWMSDVGENWVKPFAPSS
jgi:hypothetical protein